MNTTMADGKEQPVADEQPARRGGSLCVLLLVLLLFPVSLPLIASIASAQTALLRSCKAAWWMRCLGMRLTAWVLHYVLMELVVLGLLGERGYYKQMLKVGQMKVDVLNEPEGRGECGQLVAPVGGPGKGNVVFIGSSLVTYWRRLAEDFQPMKVVNAGFGGCTTETCLHFFDELVTQFQPSMIVLYVGTNDLMLKRPPEVVVNGLMEFVKRVEQKCPPGTPVIYISIPTTVLHRTWGRRRVDAITAANGMTESFINSYKGPVPLTFISWESTRLSEPENFLHDGHHLHDEGHTALASLLKPTMLALQAKYPPQAKVPTPSMTMRRTGSRFVRRADIGADSDGSPPGMKRAISKFVRRTDRDTDNENVSPKLCTLGEGSISPELVQRQEESLAMSSALGIKRSATLNIVRRTDRETDIEEGSPDGTLNEVSPSPELTQLKGGNPAAVLLVMLLFPISLPIIVMVAGGQTSLLRSCKAAWWMRCLGMRLTAWVLHYVLMELVVLGLLGERGYYKQMLKVGQMKVDVLNEPEGRGECGQLVAPVGGPGKGNVVFIGSSLVTYWRRLAEDFQPMKVVNAGFGGCTTETCLHFFDELVTQFQPSMIVLYVGTNDLMLKRPPEVVLLGIQKFVKRVEQKCPPGTPVIYISIPTTVLHRTWGRRRVDAITAANGMVESFIKGYGGLARLAYVDMDLAGLSKPENFLHDGHHLHDEGHMKLAELVKAALEGMIDANERKRAPRKRAVNQGQKSTANLARGTTMTGGIMTAGPRCFGLERSGTLNQGMNSQSLQSPDRRSARARASVIVESAQKLHTSSV